jgi:TPR repeat protein
MKCILCKMCETAKAALDKKIISWTDAQTNETVIWEREADQERIHFAHSLLSDDPTQSLQEYLALAEQGSLWSLVRVAAAFASGTGTPVDPAQAEKWYRRAYEGGSDVGLLRLGHHYLRSRQYTKAEEVFRTGTERGLAPAMSRLAWTYSKSAHWSQKREDAARARGRRGRSLREALSRAHDDAWLVRSAPYSARHSPELQGGRRFV